MKNCSGFTALLKKELTIYFGGPIFYITGFFFLLLAGYFFYTNVLYYSIVSLQAAQQAANPQVAAQLNPQMLVYRPLFAVLAIVLIFLVPLLTMRLLAEEKRSGTSELLFTYPLSDWSIILGKFGAALLVYLIFLAFTVSFSVAFSFMTQVDWGALGGRLPGPDAVGSLLPGPGPVRLQPHRKPNHRRGGGVCPAAAVLDHRLGSGDRGRGPGQGHAVFVAAGPLR